MPLHEFRTLPSPTTFWVFWGRLRLQLFLAWSASPDRPPFGLPLKSFLQHVLRHRFRAQAQLCPSVLHPLLPELCPCWGRGWGLPHANAWPPWSRLSGCLRDTMNAVPTLSFEQRPSGWVVYCDVPSRTVTVTDQPKTVATCRHVHGSGHWDSGQQARSTAASLAACLATYSTPGGKSWSANDPQITPNAPHNPPPAPSLRPSNAPDPPFTPRDPPNDAPMTPH